MFFQAALRTAGMSSALIAGVVIGGWPLAPALAEPGKEFYGRSCAICHGWDGKGAMPGVSDLSAASGRLDQDDDRLIASIMNGVSSDSMEMPPKGGLDELAKADARLILNYMRRTFGGPRFNTTEKPTIPTKRDTK